MSMWAVGFNYYMLGSDTMEITAEREREQKKGDNMIKKGNSFYHTLPRVPTNTIQTHTHTHNRK